MSFRVMPNIVCIRPADANETREAWKVAIERQGGPVALILTRQNVPVIDQSKFGKAEGLRKGAYVLADNSQGDPELILIASGSEVHVALEAYEKLAQEGVKVRVVSMPSFELFEEQPKSYQEEVLPPSVKKRIAIEAGANPRVGTSTSGRKEKSSVLTALEPQHRGKPCLKSLVSAWRISSQGLRLCFPGEVFR